MFLHVDEMNIDGAMILQGTPVPHTIRSRTHWHAQGKRSCGINMTIVVRHVATSSCVVELGAKLAAEFRMWCDGRLGNTFSRHLIHAVFPGRDALRARSQNRLLAEKFCTLVVADRRCGARVVDECPGLPQSFATRMREFCGSAGGSFCWQSTASVCSFESGGAKFFEFSEKRDSGD